MSARHHVLRRDEGEFVAPRLFGDRCRGYGFRSAVDGRTGAVHTGFGIGRLDPDGWVDWHVHSYEESLYILDGELVLETVEGAYRMRDGDYGVIAVGQPHRLWNDGSAVAELARMTAPQPRPDGSDTFLVPSPHGDATRQPIDPRDPRTRSFGHIAPEHMDPVKQTQDLLAVSASMRTALLVYSGITVKMMVDSDLGAFLSTMFMVQYEPDGLAGAHDHPFEETYLILEGGVDAVFDGTEYRLEAGDIAFAGVGCPHRFSNPGDRVVRWLETQAPQPPARHSYRFARDWEYLEGALGTETSDGSDA